MWEDDKNSNTLKNFNLYKISFKKYSSKDSKNTEGGQGRLEKFQTEADFFSGWLPLQELSMDTTILYGEDNLAIDIDLE